MFVLMELATYSELFETGNGYRYLLGYLMAPEEIVVGDILCMLHGCRNPMMLKSFGDHDIIVGSCYVLKLREDEDEVVEAYLSERRFQS